MELDENKKFLLYLAGTGILMILLGCVLQLCIIPGSKCQIPYINDNRKTYVYSQPPNMELKIVDNYYADIQTNLGSFRIDLFEKNAPTTVNNFVFLAKEGYYDGVTIHRVFKDFLFQTGSRTSMDRDINNDGFGSPGYVIPDEVNWDSLDLSAVQRDELISLGYASSEGIVSISIEQDSVVMANAGKGNTGGSQFFIVTASNEDTRLPALQGKYTVFGKVTSGFDTLKKINEAKVKDNDLSNPVPSKTIEVQSIKITQAGPVNGQPIPPNDDASYDDQTVRVSP